MYNISTIYSTCIHLRQKATARLSGPSEKLGGMRSSGEPLPWRSKRTFHKMSSRASWRCQVSYSSSCSYTCMISLIMALLHTTGSSCIHTLPCIGERYIYCYVLAFCVHMQHWMGRWILRTLWMISLPSTLQVVVIASLVHWPRSPDLNRSFV